MTVALASLALMIVMFFSALVFGALRQEMPPKAANTVWTRDR